jgi:putative membrane protein
VVLGLRNDDGALGLDPLTDQQLAGVIMWIPAGGIYLAAALVLLVTWIRATEREEVML